MTKRPASSRLDFTYQYGTQTINYSVWVTGKNSPIHTVVYLGTVQIGRLPAWIARHSPMGTVVVQGAPHWLASDDGSDILEFMQRFTKEAFMAILTLPCEKRLNIIADSQAAPGVLWLSTLSSNAGKVNKLILVQPLGLNSTAFTGMTTERIRLFKKRITRNARYQLSSLLSDRRLLYNHTRLLRTVGYNNAKSNAQYGSGLTHDGVSDLKKLYDARIAVVIICGENDKIFPPQEIQATLRRYQLDIPVVVVPGVPHSPLATRLGMKLLDEARRELN
jgi:hypothetical protein